ncbi:VCBS repeat-containing protein [Streptomyces sp. R302]|uniref:FG-GAP repeat domain-containing protein n=1 Tax=unclassified Streptomyces TaxID=2593676 RepID=UPI00145DF694|nr:MULTISPECIES: VCBS repeat-containing protein [unclassified Streptomyces]NML50209.1 VCBS repeat-containing protein [Streptomyces sp. R301]NML79200.1 VCBS repeat-containing protein [Streptomyces sp. R302]
MSRLITTALAVALAAGTATPALAAPALAAPAAVAEAADDQLLPLPAGQIVGAGATGYLVHDSGASTYNWVRFDTGAVTELPYARIPYVHGSDSVVQSTHYGPTTVRDMTTGAVVLTVDNSRLYDANVLGSVGSTLLAVFPDQATGSGRLALYRPGADATAAVGSWATGLPADATAIWTGALKGSSVGLSYTSGGKGYLASLDLASGVVSGEKESPLPDGVTASDDSPTLRAWLKQDPSAEYGLTLQDPKTTATRSHNLGHAYRPSVHVVGGWALYADALRSFVRPSSLQALRARSFSGTEVKVLDTFAAGVREPDGTLLVQGGTLAQGEGLFRIRAGADGKPVATMIATNKVPVKLVLERAAIPSVVDLDKNGGTANLDWILSRVNVEAEIVLRHRRTGRTFTTTVLPPYNAYVDNHTARLRWDGSYGLERALNGAYDWQFTATPLDGLGPDVSSSGSFTVTRKVNPRDLNDNGSPDLLVRNRAGTLTRLDTYHAPADRRFFGHVGSAVGGGWQVYDRIETTGNLAGTAVGDLVARDRDGVLWLYQGNNRGGFLGRVRVGGGWQVYDKLTGGSDLTGDGRNDLLAADKSGVLWLYPGTGSTTRPFTTRKRIGGGWQTYDRLAATGNLAGAAAGDLVARDRDGVLWLYLGKGDGTFAPRTRIGGGWNAYTDITGAADMNNDGRNDLVAMDRFGEPFVYQGTGSWKAPFQRAYRVSGSQHEHDLMS